jgi:hypothetical protein
MENKVQINFLLNMVSLVRKSMKLCKVIGSYFSVSYWRIKEFLPTMRKRRLLEKFAPSLSSEPMNS